MGPWLTIWFQPRHTLRKQLLQDPFQSLIFLAVLAGLLNGLSWILYAWNLYPYADRLQRFNLILASLCAGIIYSVVNLYLVGWLYTWTGSWIDGKGTFTDLKCATGWSYYPFIVTGFFLLLPQLFSFPNDIKIGMNIFGGILGLWSVIVLFQLISEAHGFSFRKGFLTFLLSLLVVLFAVFILTISTAIYRVMGYFMPMAE